MNSLLKRSVLSLTILFTLGLFLTTTAADKAKLEERIEDSIADYYNDPIDVTVQEDGEVVLEGEVNVLHDKYRIYEIVSKIPGVKSISNQILVETDQILPDDIIEQNIQQQIEMTNKIIDPAKIEVSVSNGVVMLSGKVNYFREKIWARHYASWQEGVKGVVNNIDVMPREKVVTDDHLTYVVQQILDEQFPTQTNVKYSVENGKVTLEGTVSTLWAKEEMEEEISRVIGVKSVENNLKI